MASVEDSRTHPVSSKTILVSLLAQRKGIGSQFCLEETFCPMSSKKKIKVPKGHHLIFRRFRRDPKSGKMLDARLYGIKAWPIVVADNTEAPA